MKYRKFKSGQQKGLTVLVLGATGHQGGATALELLKRGFNVRTITRKPSEEKAAMIEEQGVEVMQGDLDDQRSVESALSGCWGAFGLFTSYEKGPLWEEMAGKKFADSAKSAGVAHFVYSSVSSADRNTGIPHFDSKRAIELHVEEAGFPSWTIIRPVAFMENYLMPMNLHSLAQGKLVTALNPDLKQQLIAVADIGRYCAMAFDKTSAFNTRAIDIAGDTITPMEAAAIIGKAMGRKIEYVRQDIEEIRKFSPDLAKMDEWMNTTGYNVDIPALERTWGIKPVKFVDWASKIKWKQLTAVNL